MRNRSNVVEVVVIISLGWVLLIAGLRCTKISRGIFKSLAPIESFNIFSLTMTWCSYILVVGVTLGLPAVSRCKIAYKVKLQSPSIRDLSSALCCKVSFPEGTPRKQRLGSRPIYPEEGKPKNSIAVADKAPTGGLRSRILLRDVDMIGF